MWDRQKIHVFLGAPPPSSDPAVGSEAGQEAEERPPSDTWRHLELTWQDGHLRPATDEAGDQCRVSPEEDDQSVSSPEAGKVTSDKRTRRSDDHRPAERFLSSDEEPDPEKEDQCSSSVQEYLDSCFPAEQPEPPVPPLSAHTQFLSTWTLSQALILRGRRSIQSASSPDKTRSSQTPPKDAQTPPSISSSTPELFSPFTPSPGASAELFSPLCSTPRVEECGVVIQTTADGVLCSQEARQPANQTSPTKSPEFKRTRMTENIRTETSAATSRSTATTSTTTGLQGPTTLLINSDKQGLRCSVLVAVVHPCHLKEVKVRSGPSAGTFIPLASIVVTDQSGVEKKVVLWRRAAFWTLTVRPGDVLLITGLQVNEDRWRGETVLQSTFNSKLLNLGQITASTCPPVPQHVDARSLTSLCDFLRERRPLLVTLNLRPPQDLNRLPYAALRSLRVNTLVNALLRVTHTHISTEWRSEAESRWRSAVQLKAVVSVEQPDGQQGALLLWGAAVDWLPRFNQDRAAVWDFHVLLVRDGLTSDLPELHSTPWSSVQPLDPAGLRAQDFLRPRRFRTGTSSSSSVELDLETLLSQKYSGEVELRVHITSFHFQSCQPSQNAPQPVLDSSTSLDGIVAALSGDVTYTGCARCSVELDTDANGIYSPCYPCLPHTAVRRYYRPAVLTVSGRGHSQVCVQVPPVELQKILEAPADKLQRSSAPGSEVKNLQVAAERIRSLLFLPSQTFTVTVQSHFLCDENSVPISRDFTLLDLQFPR